jgi:hypothetical protein
MPADLRRTRRGASSPLWLGLWCVAILAVAYPLIADRTQAPLAVFVIPILITSALGSWDQAALVGAAASGIALLEGLLDGDLDGAALAARMAIIVITAGIGILVAAERGRRQRSFDDSNARVLLLDTLQDSLVPVPIPPPGVVVSVKYLPGDDRLVLGGDFFDAIVLPNGALGYIIGDVCGQGARAAAFGAAVRSGWKTLATVSPDDPMQWVQGLDDSFFRLGRHADTYVTLNTGVVHLDGERRWRFVSAGHPWPIVVTDHASKMVEPAVGPPLGVGFRSAWRESDQALPNDDATLLLYTDGLTESAHPVGGARRTHDGEGRLLDYLRRSGRRFDIGALLDELGPSGYEDDVAVIAIALGGSS